MVRKSHPGITAKRMGNKRFKRTEDAILRVFFENDQYVSMEEMARKVGVARSTVYYHHRTIGEIIPDYERYLLRYYRRKIRSVIASEGAHMRMVYVNVLLFVLKYRENFAMMIQCENKKILEKMMREVMPRAGKFMRLPKNSERILKIYASEVIEVIWMWGEAGFAEEKVESTLGDMMFLTDTVRQRLRPMLKI